MILSTFLYGILGFVLALSGVGVMEKPIHFIAIMAVVMLIDIKTT